MKNFTYQTSVSVHDHTETKWKCNKCGEEVWTQEWTCWKQTPKEIHKCRKSTTKKVTK